jgi:membrane protease YdiL (CAAX protease family)
VDDPFSRVKIGLTWFGAALIVIGLLLALYFPAIPKNWAGWVVLIGLGLPVWFGIEWFGEKVIQALKFRQMSSGMRILLGVPVMAALCVGAAYVIRYVQIAIMSV